ncbi:MAG: hypothetical protein R3185_09005 [Candidatus Thermoplasmatota archaeon]|nr:hypothetical protein [Candidatus Thermoplasmatota archaeon]
MASEYVEVRLLIEEDKVDEFLTFCEERLDTMPAIHRIPANANGYEVLEEIEAKANGDA